jgi:hypothetical protein
MTFDDWDDKLVEARLRAALLRGDIELAKRDLRDVGDPGLRQELRELIQEYES